MARRQKNIDLLKNIVAWLISLVVILPAVVILINSFKTRAESYTLTLQLPKSFEISNYTTVIEKGKLGISFINSMIYATISSALIIILTCTAAFIMSRNQIKLNKFLYFFIILGIAMPVNYITLLKVMQILHLINTRFGMILLYTAFNIPISLFISYGFVKTIPKEIDEAAIIDGCPPIKLYTKIILPLLTPVISTLFALNFMSCWNDFILPLYYLNSSEKWPMTLAVYNFFGMFMTEWNLVCADIVLTSLPVLVVYILGQKYIVNGITAGAVKG
ncbi:carbohydrate ABC transporter permease [Caldicellulosiruptoraceae bacterium PP1]